MSKPPNWPAPLASERVLAVGQPAAEAQRPIVVTFDGKYVRAAAATLRSLARVRTGKPTTVIALVGGISRDQARALSVMASATGLVFELRDVSRFCPADLLLTWSSRVLDRGRGSWGSGRGRRGRVAFLAAILHCGASPACPQRRDRGDNPTVAVPLYEPNRRPFVEASCLSRPSTTVCSS
jgi:hypothetical protein